jgi:hypothetical protein
MLINNPESLIYFSPNNQGSLFLSSGLKRRIVVHYLFVIVSNPALYTLRYNPIICQVIYKQKKPTYSTHNAGDVVVNSEVVRSAPGVWVTDVWGGKVYTGLKCAISSLRNTFKLAYGAVVVETASDRDDHGFDSPPMKFFKTLCGNVVFMT